MAMDPNAVTIHDKREIAPTFAMFVGSMMIPDPIMFTATMNVSWIRFIRFACCSGIGVLLSRRSLADDVGVKLDAPVHPFLKHALDLVVEAGELIERLLKG